MSGAAVRGFLASGPARGLARFDALVRACTVDHVALAAVVNVIAGTVRRGEAAVYTVRAADAPRVVDLAARTDVTLQAVEAGADAYPVVSLGSHGLVGGAVSGDRFEAVLTADEQTLLAAMQAEIAALTHEGAYLALDVDPVTALQLAGLLQLTLRHPALPPANAAAARELLRAVIAFFAGYPAILELLRRGDDPAHDHRLEVVP